MCWSGRRSREGLEGMGRDEMRKGTGKSLHLLLPASTKCSIKLHETLVLITSRRRKD